MSQSWDGYKQDPILLDPDKYIHLSLPDGSLSKFTGAQVKAAPAHWQQTFHYFPFLCCLRWKSFKRKGECSSFTCDLLSAKYHIQEWWVRATWCCLGLCCTWKLMFDCIQNPWGTLFFLKSSLGNNPDLWRMVSVFYTNHHRAWSHNINNMS